MAASADAKAPWRSTFDFFDLDRSGTISVAEFKKCLEVLGHTASEEQVREMIKEVDPDESGELDYDEFVQLMTSKEAHKIDKATLKNFFQILDKDSSGYITAAELRHEYTTLGHGLTDEQMDAIMMRYDLDGNGQWTFDEFLQFVDGSGIEVEGIDDVEDEPAKGKPEKPRVESAQVAPTKRREVSCAEFLTGLLRPLFTSAASGARKEDTGRLLNIKDPALAGALKPLLDAEGKVRLTDLERAADLWTKHRGVKCTDPESDPALHWEKDRAKHGLGEVIYKANHIALIVSDVGRSAAFYSDVIGLQQIRRPDFDRHGAWFTMGNLELHLIKGIPVVHSGKDLIVGHISIETFDIDKVPGILQRCGVPFRQNVSVPKGKMAQGGGTNDTNDSGNIVKQYFLRDPDGYYLEICNCDVLTKYCLGHSEELAGYDHGVALHMKEAALFVNLAEKLASGAARMERELVQLCEELRGRSLEEIAARLGCTTRAKGVDEDKLKKLLTRCTVYGDICQNETEETIREILLIANNHVPSAMKIMEVRGWDSAVYQPPAFFEEGVEKVKPVAFKMSRSGNHAACV